MERSSLKGEYMRLSHNFIKGYNTVKITKINVWRSGHSYQLDYLDDLVIYLKDIGFEIISYNEYGLKVLILSDKQLDYFYHKVIDYK